MSTGKKTWRYDDPRKSELTPVGFGFADSFSGYSRQAYGSPHASDPDHNPLHPTHDKWRKESEDLLMRIVDEEPNPNKFNWESVAAKMQVRTGRADYTADDCRKKRETIMSTRRQQKRRAREAEAKAAAKAAPSDSENEDEDDFTSGSESETEEPTGEMDSDVFKIITRSQKLEEKRVAQQNKTMKETMKSQNKSGSDLNKAIAQVICSPNSKRKAGLLSGSAKKSKKSKPSPALKCNLNQAFSGSGKKRSKKSHAGGASPSPFAYAAKASSSSESSSDDDMEAESEFNLNAGNFSMGHAPPPKSRRRRR